MSARYAVLPIGVLLFASSVLASAVKEPRTACPCDATTNHSALTELFLLTQGPNWGGNTTNWCTAHPVCEWGGLSCMGSLLSMQLTDFHLNGSLPESIWASIGNLGAVTFKWCPSMNPFPAFLGAANLTNITVAGDDLFSGGYPSEWGSLSQLTAINVNVNGFDPPNVTLPQSWGALAQLRELNLATMCGELPESWSGMTKLRRMSIYSGCGTPGTVPSSWAALLALQELHIRQAGVSGALPAWIGDLPNIMVVRLTGNRFNGTIPDSWHRATTLIDIDLSNNQLTGALPPSWGSMTRLSSLTLSENRLTGPLPSSWGSMEVLQRLFLSSNSLSGDLPSEWSAWDAIEYLDLQFNQLTGPIPQSWYTLLNRNFNSTRDPFSSLMLSNNQLTGRPDLCAFRAVGALATPYTLSNNTFSGMPNISCFPSGCDSPSLQNALAGNNFCGVCSQSACQCAMIPNESIAAVYTIQVLEIGTTAECCVACKNVPQCAAAVFFAYGGFSYCELKNVSAPLIAKPGYTVLTEP